MWVMDMDNGYSGHIIDNGKWVWIVFNIDLKYIKCNLVVCSVNLNSLVFSLNQCHC